MGSRGEAGAAASEDGQKTPFEGKLSAVAKSRTPSRLRSLAPALAIPDVIWLAGGLPSGDVFPLTSVSITTKYGEAITMDDPAEMYAMQQYNLNAAGYKPLLDWATDHTAAMHKPPNDKWKVLVTCGNSDAMAMLFESLLDAGDVLLVEESNFAASMSTLHPVAAGGARIEPVPLEPDGSISSRGLEAVLEKLAGEGLRPKLLYTVPTGQNPTGASMSLQQLQAVYDICCSHDILVMEDDPYWYLQFPEPGSDPPGLQALASSFLSIDTQARVVRLDSLAKFLAPGFRGGWITAPEPLHTSLVIRTTQSSHGQSSISSVMFHRLLVEWGEQGLHRHLQRLQAEYARRAALVVKEAEAQLQGLAEWAAPRAGMFLWLRVLDVEDTEALMAQLETHKVVLVPGRFFSFHDAPSPCFRLCFASAGDEALVEGVRRLASVLREKRQEASAC